VVQARQNWAPNHPNVAVNKAMAVGMGKARIALFLDPLRLVVDERQAPLADGQSLLLPDGIEVTRSGTNYLITSAHGETVRAEVIDNSWIGGTFMNIAVALNYVSSGGMRGLLGNGNGNLLDDLSTRDADTLRQPVTFGELYRDFAESMRVQAAQSLFVKINVAGNDGPSVIAEATFELPTRPYTVSDLTPQEYRVARAACKKVGLTAAAMLDACTLDTAVLGSPDVAKMYSRVLVVPQGVLNPGVGIVDPDTGCALQCAETQCNKRSHHHAAHRTPDSRDNK
jgi:hypothetical protein